MAYQEASFPRGNKAGHRFEVAGSLRSSYLMVVNILALSPNIGPMFIQADDTVARSVTRKGGLLSRSRSHENSRWQVPYSSR